MRAHWGIENKLHWVLDLVFRDDPARRRTGHGPENMAVIAQFAVNLVHTAKPTSSLKNRRKRAAWDLDHLGISITSAPSSAEPREPVHPLPRARRCCA